MNTDTTDDSLDNELQELILHIMKIAEIDFGMTKGLTEKQIISAVHTLEPIIQAECIKAQLEVWERAMGIISNAGDIWDKDTTEAIKWREVARAFNNREAYGNWPAIAELDKEAK